MIFLYKAGSLTFATSVKSESVKFESSFIYKSWPPDTDLAFPPICFSGKLSLYHNHLALVTYASILHALDCRAILEFV